MAAEIIHDNDIAGPQDPNQLLFNISLETFSIDRTIKYGRCGELIAPQGSNEGHRSPMATRSVAAELLALCAPTSQRRHIGFYPGLIKKHQTARIKAALYGFPALPPPGDIGTGLFKSEQCFF